MQNINNHKYNIIFDDKYTDIQLIYKIYSYFEGIENIDFGGYNYLEDIIKSYIDISIIEVPSLRTISLSTIRKNKDICVNFIVPKRTRKEYRSDNKEKINNQKKQSYIRNKDKILAQQKEFRDLNKDEINAKRRNNIARKIRINELRRKKYAENKEEIFMMISLY